MAERIEVLITLLSGKRTKACRQTARHARRGPSSNFAMCWQAHCADLGRSQARKSSKDPSQVGFVSPNLIFTSMNYQTLLSVVSYRDLCDLILVLTAYP